MDTSKTELCKESVKSAVKSALHERARIVALLRGWAWGDGFLVSDDLDMAADLIELGKDKTFR